jgi:hypothetical protein
MNTPVGVPPTVVHSVRKMPAGWELELACECGNALLTLSDNFDFVALKRN